MIDRGQGDGRLWTRHLAAWRRERRELGALRAALLRVRDGLGVVETSQAISGNAHRVDVLEQQLHAVVAHLHHLQADADAARAREVHAGEREVRALEQIQALTNAHTMQQRELRVAHFMVWLAFARPTSKTMVSVVLPTRNRLEWLESAVASVAVQSHEAWELLIVDDGSSDGTSELLARIDDERVQTIRAEGVGVCAARNLALEQATGSIVVYLDDDNLMHPDWLRAVVWAFDRHPDVDVLFGARVIDDEDVVHGRGHGGLPFLHWHPYDRTLLETGNTVDMNVISHRSDLREARFDESLSALGDWDLFLRLTEERAPMELPALACIYTTDAHDRLTAFGAPPEETARVHAKLQEREASP